MALSQQSLISASCDLVSSSRVGWTGSHGYWQGSKRTDGITQGLLRLTLRTNTMSITLPSLDQSKSQGQLKFKEWKNTLFLLMGETKVHTAEGCGYRKSDQIRPFLEYAQLPQRNYLTKICEEAHISRKHHHWVSQYPNVHSFSSFYFVIWALHV